MTELSDRRLPLVPASFFGIVLGLVGLGNPWRVAARVWGLYPLPGELIMLAGVTVWAIVLTLYSAKWILARESALAEMRHPIQCCFVGLAGVSTMMVSMAVAPYSRLVAQILFIVGLIFTAAFAAWRTGGLWMGGRPSEAVTPVLYLPTVAGGFVAASAGSSLGFANLSQVAFGAAFFSWLAIESVVIQRLFTAEPVESALRPTLFIQLAPPTVGGVAALNALGDAWSILPGMMFGYGVLSAVVLLRLTPWIVGKSFTSAYWGSAFGTTALSMLALRLAEDGSLPIAASLAPWLFVGANVVVGVLIVGSLRLIAKGQFVATAPRRASWR